MSNDTNKREREKREPDSGNSVCVPSKTARGVFLSDTVRA
jgi:hypothetical protein